MKNRINQPSTDQHAHNDRPLYFTDQSSADEVARLIHSPSAATSRKCCPMWQPVIDDPVAKERLDS